MNLILFLGDEAQLEAHFGPFGDSANLDVPLDLKSFLTHPMEILGDVGPLESHFSPCGDNVSVSAR
jgi:hypothetical protein